jgi:hypothetical protein
VDLLIGTCPVSELPQKGEELSSQTEILGDAFGLHRPSSMAGSH